MDRKLVVFLHGVGSRGADLAGLGEAWRMFLPTEVAYAAPDAPTPSEFGHGFQWFSVNGVTESNRSERIVAAREAFDATLNRLLDQHQVAPENLVLVGFSQGSIMALDLLATGRMPLAGVVAFSGRLASPEPLYPRADIPLLLVHGKRDPIMPWPLSEAAAKRLQVAGVKVDIHLEEGLVHTISETGADRARRFIETCFGVA